MRATYDVDNILLRGSVVALPGATGTDENPGSLRGEQAVSTDFGRACGDDERRVELYELLWPHGRG